MAVVPRRSLPVTWKNPGKRLTVLEGDEVEALLYGRPCFTHEECVQYFALSPKEKAALDQLHSLKSVGVDAFSLGSHARDSAVSTGWPGSMVPDVGGVRSRLTGTTESIPPLEGPNSEVLAPQ